MSRAPVTPAVRALRAAGVPFGEHLYDYVERGGTAHSSACLGVPEHIVIKTLVLEDEAKRPLLVLMHGDLQASTQKLARDLGLKRIGPCSPEVAARHTGYLVGGTSPFGTKKALPVFAEASIEALPLAYINGGKRGFLVSLAGADIFRVLSPRAVTVGVDG